MTKGRAEVCIITQRRSGESCHPGLVQSDSPLDKLVAALHRLRSSEGRLHAAFEPLELQEPEWKPLERHLPQVRILDITQYSVAASGNVTENKTEGRVEVRYHPPLRIPTIEKWLHESLGELDDPSITYTLTSWNEPGVMEAHSGLHRTVCSLAESAGLTFEPAAFLAGSDMSALINIHELPTCIASCADFVNNRIHDDNEFITERELLQTVTLYAALMLGYEGAHSLS
jgi:acetylornithine deacetylase/succinyl-diaminopimelate desuccinylase-like protein